MATLQRAISSYTNTGTTEVINGTDSVPQTVPIYTNNRAGAWEYTNNAGDTSVCCDASQTQAQAEAHRDAWLSAGGVA